jgi:hypothetical protein
MMVGAVVVMMMVRMWMMVATMTFRPCITLALNANILRPAAAYLAHGYLLVLIVAGRLAEGSPAYCSSPQTTSLR